MFCKCASCLIVILRLLISFIEFIILECKDDITSNNKIDKTEVKNDSTNSQVQLAQVKELKDDGELKIADKSDFK